MLAESWRDSAYLRVRDTVGMGLYRCLGRPWSFQLLLGRHPDTERLRCEFHDLKEEKAKLWHYVTRVLTLDTLDVASHDVSTNVPKLPSTHAGRRRVP